MRQNLKERIRKGGKFSNKGITLVALVVTIIILLILAGIAISQLTQTGLFSRANQAKTDWTNAQNKEETTLGEYEEAINQYTSGNESSSESEDITEPSADITLSTTTIYTTGAITATVTHSDDESGVDIENCKWIYNTTSSEIGTDAGSYTGGTFSSNPETITLQTSTVGTYYLHVLTTDGAGNSKETISEAVTVSPSHTITTISYTWAELSSIAKIISNTSSITKDTEEVSVTLNGETKTLGVGDTTTVDSNKVRILGFNHDDLTDPEAYGSTTATGKAGISFEYVSSITTAAMNASKSNSGGWGACTLRGTLNDTTKDTLTEIKDYIKQVNKEYIAQYNKANSMTSSSDYLWLLSSAEIWANGGWSVALEGNQYRYYVMYLGSGSYTAPSSAAGKGFQWYLRSTPRVTGFSFCQVYFRRVREIFVRG